VQSDSIEIYVESKSISNYLWSKFETFKTRVVGSLAETVPVGHGPVGTFPDRPYLRWKYEYETGGVVERNNVEDFTKASERLHAFFREFVKDNIAHGDPVEPVSWISIEDKIRTILKQEGPVEERTRLWKEAISANELFPATDEDKTVTYSDKAWGSARTAYYLATAGNIDSCDSCLFIRAARKHRNFVLHELLPRIGLIAC
jgi:hypothetical protein